MESMMLDISEEHSILHTLQLLSSCSDLKSILIDTTICRKK